METFSGRHVVYDCKYHLVFVTKYRRNAINSLNWQTLLEKFKSVMQDFGGSLVEADWEEDHAHLLVTLPPKHSVSKLVNSLKGVSSRASKVKKLWSPSYFVLTCGGAPIKVIQQYIKNQRNSSPA